MLQGPPGARAPAPQPCVKGRHTPHHTHTAHLRRLLQLSVQVGVVRRQVSAAAAAPRRGPGQAALHLRLLRRAQQAVQAAHRFIEQRQRLAGGQAQPLLQLQGGKKARGGAHASRWVCGW